jgi:hypothetical protein
MMKSDHLPEKLEDDIIKPEDLSLDLEGGPDFELLGKRPRRSTKSKLEPDEIVSHLFKKIYY